MQNVRGVNLGGWLVIERWMTPSLFEGTGAQDEYSLCQELGPEQAQKRLTEHRDSFITEERIELIREFGLNTVRVPVGYWLFGDEAPFVSGAHRYVDELFRWARKLRVQVILDFHAAPGSQNGWDHSGKAGVIGWPVPGNVDKSLEFIRKLCERYGHEEMLIGVEPLNEPHWDVRLATLVKYYERAAEIIRENCSRQVKVIVSDSFRWKQMSKALRRQGADYVLDIHLYQLFTPEDRALDLKGHLGKVDRQWRREIGELTKYHEVLVGEWSAAMSELFGSVPEIQRAYGPEDYRSYFRAQRNLFEELKVGRTYWTARTEGGGPWSLLDHPDYL
jgi:glucan 1,3-beta-glucosidase